MLNPWIMDPVDSKWVRFSCWCCWLNWPCDIFTILNMRACQVFISTVFTVSHVELQLPQPLRLDQSRPNSRLSVSVLMYSICFWELHIFSSPQWPLQGHLRVSADIWWRLQKHVGGFQAVNLWSPDVSIHIVFKQTLSPRRRHWAVRREASQRAFLTPHFSPQAIFLSEKDVRLQM